MRVISRSVLLCLLGVVLGGFSGAGDVAGAEPGGDGAASEPLSGAPLVVGSVDRFLLGGEESHAAHEARRSRPEAAMRRRFSRTGFEGLAPEQAAGETKAAFPNLIEHPTGGPPPLSAGQRIIDYTTDDSAQVSLPGGSVGVVESLAPIAVRSSHGRHLPLDLHLEKVDGRFQPVRGDVAVDLPANLSNGVSLSGAGVSVTPVDGQGSPLNASEGSLDGSAVVWGDRGGATGVPDVETVAKASPEGFDLSSVLLSERSPGTLYFRVGMPVGARLRSEPDGSVEIVGAHGSTLAVIAPVSAHDAEGTEVPVSVSAHGHVLVVKVALSGDYMYPIVVDPELIVPDGQLVAAGAKRSNWKFETTNPAAFGESTAGERLETRAIGTYSSGQVGYWVYRTKGVSKIYEFSSETEGKNSGGKIASRLELAAHGGGEENKEILSNESENAEYSRRSTVPVLCPKNAKGEPECVPTAGGAGNAVFFQQSATGTGSSFSDILYQGVASISEPIGTHATTEFNTKPSEVTVETENEKKEIVKTKRSNVLYGAGSWLSKYTGAFETIAKDTGIGVSATKLEYQISPGKWEQIAEHNYLEKENKCEGVQCYEHHEEVWTLPKLPDGEDKIRYSAKEAIPGAESLASEGETYVKVDTTPPHGIAVHGLPYGNELSERQYELTTEAIDGEGTTVPSSGVKSTTLFVDGVSVKDKEQKEIEEGKSGKEAGKKEGECQVAKGACVAGAKWIVNGSELGAGHHWIQVVAVDNAGNEGRLPGGGTEISIRHSTPVALGPGSVDLQSGDFTLGATDASMGDGLTVGRNYSSRGLARGSNGPLGPDWNLSLGSTESLEELIDGDVMLTAGNGSQTIFAHLSGGKFESPVGDSNLELSVEENKTTKEKLAYYLKDATAHTSVEFKRLVGGSNWVPTVQEGATASDTTTVQYQTSEHYAEYPLKENSLPENIVSGPGGNLWFTERNANKVVEMPTTGGLTEFASEKEPEDIIAGPDGDIWITYGAGSLSVAQMTTSGKTVHSWELGIEHYTIYPEDPGRIAAGPDGNVWFVDSSKQQIGKLTPTGGGATYNLPSGSVPSSLVTGSDGNIWFTESGTNKIGKITPAGEVTQYPAEGTNPKGITEGPNHQAWFSYAGEDKIGEITTTGTVTRFTLPAETEPSKGLVTGSDGNVWFMTSGISSKIGKITPTGSVSLYSVPTELDGLTTGPDGNLWFTGRPSEVGMLPVSGVNVEPIEELAPKAAGVGCTPELKPGCRALKFEYATTTTATGENSSQWGAFKTRLKRVIADMYNSAAGKMQETTVAEYAYDKFGRLRAEWDPRVTPSLKTSYGYDEEGHISALTAPGQESWAFTYGTIAGDSGTGRLLKLTQAPASASLWNGEQVTNTEGPKVSGVATEGVKLLVEKGKWSGSPVAYSYQWSRCSSGSCSTILGATNANYTPQAADVGDTLRATVGATNGGGTVTASVEMSSAVKSIASSLTAYSLPSGSQPTGLVAGPQPETMWFTESESNKIGKITSTGAITEYALPSGSSPEGIVKGPDENLWFTDHGTNKIGKITTAGVITEYALPTKSHPRRIAVGPDGNLWFTDLGSSKIGKITTAGVITEYPLPSGSYPFGIVSGPDGNLWFTDWETSKVGKITTAGAVTEYAMGAGSFPEGIAVGPDGNLWVADEQGGKVTKVTTSGAITQYPVPADGEYIASVGEALWITGKESPKLYRIATSGAVTGEFRLPTEAGPRQMVSVAGALWYADFNNKIAKLSLSALSEGAATAPEPGITLNYGVPISGGGAPYNMSASEVSKWGQSDAPREATAITAPDEPQGWPASSYKRATVYYLDEEGRQVNVANPSTAPDGSISTTEYNEFNDVVRKLSPDARQTALEAGANSVAVSKLLDTQNTYNGEGAKEGEVEEPGTRLIESFGPEHEVKYTPNGFSGREESLARLHTEYHYDEGAPGGEKYDLMTEKSQLAELFNSEGKKEEEVEVRKSKTSYSGQSNLGWELREPTSVTEASESGGLKITHTTVYYAKSDKVAPGEVKETRGPAGASGESAHDTRTIYYGAEANTEGYSACGNHPEWAGLVCETLPAKQPEGTVAPKLPVTTVTYNMWDEPLVTTETFGSTVRTKTDTYDEAGRLSGSETTSTADTALPKVTNEYNSTTGLLEKQSTTVEGKTKTITSKYNTLGQKVEYTDADGNVAKYKYGGLENDYLLEEMTDGSDVGTGKQTYSYNATTKQMEKLVDSAAGAFTASYDAEGKLTSEVYPNGMCANAAYNAAGEATHIEYIKTTNCAEHEPGVWYSESRTPSVRGETFSRTSTLASESYFYDTAGRLVESQETPAGEGCTTRLYAYDEESNRTSQTTRVPGSKGECASEGGTVLKHTYDEGNRLTDTGIAYDSFGNVTTLPAADGEGHELTSTFYVDGAVATQSQNGVSYSYNLDPEGRIRESVSGTSTTIDHYDGAGEAIAWTSLSSGGSTRNIPGIGGSLAATQTNGETPVLQLHDLQGDVVATIGDKSGEAKLLSTYNSTEFGVPNGGKAPPKYAWLGAGDVASFFSSGVITYGATSYVPQTGMALQSEEVEPPGLPEGSGGGEAYTMQQEAWVMQNALRVGAEEVMLEAARERAAQEAAERAAEEAEEAEEAGGEAGTPFSISEGAGKHSGNRHKMAWLALTTRGSGSCLPIKRCRREEQEEKAAIVRHERKITKLREEGWTSLKEKISRELEIGSMEAMIEQERATVQAMAEADAEAEE